MFGGQKRKVIFTTVTLREVALLQDCINHIDPNTFITVIQANEVLGSGFKTLKEKLEG